jgi:hypothetical protein
VQTPHPARNHHLNRNAPMGPHRSDPVTLRSTPLSKKTAIELDELRVAYRRFAGESGR